ncbi:hypothetical protein QBC43DRAFT_373028 [Cladorrhinum sp. PSN259]|nr:hypothetical protein QBC43DRAFT_373028 [Cladorrhinum sp. PSN259]
MAKFNDLPPEIILDISDWIRSDRPADDYYWFRSLAALVKVNRKCHEILNPVLFRSGLNSALRWAVQSNDVHLLKLALHFAGPNRCAAIAERQKISEDGRTSQQPQLLWNGSMTSWQQIRNAHGQGFFDWRLSQPDIATVRDSGFTASLLHLAAASGAQAEIINLLLDNGAEMNATSQHLCTCFPLQQHLSFRLDNYYFMIVRHPREELRVHQRYQTQNPVPQWRPLHHAICSGNSAVSLLLLQGGAPLVTADGGFSVSTLECATAHGRVEVVRAIIERQHRQNAPDQQTSNSSPVHIGHELQFTAMHYLALCRDFEAAKSIAKLLQEIGLSLDEPASSPSRSWRRRRLNGSPLSLALYLGNFVAAKALLHVGANPHTDSSNVDHLNLLSLALSAPYSTWTRERQNREFWEKDRNDLVKQALQAGVDPNSREPSPLMLTIRNRYVAELKTLIEHGKIDLEKLGSSTGHMTALMYAAKNADPLLVETLLAAGVNVNIRSESSYTATSVAVSTQVTSFSQHNSEARLATLRLLLEHGAEFGPPTCDLPTSAPLSQIISAVMDTTHKEVQRASNGAYFDYFVEHCTEANLAVDTFRQAVVYAVDVICQHAKSREPNLSVCQKLSNLGTRLGYILDDDSADRIVSQLCSEIESGGVAFLEVLNMFSTSEDALLTTTSGVMTPEALLVLQLLICRDTKNQILRELVTGNYNIGMARIKFLHGASLLHLACLSTQAAPKRLIRCLLSLSDDWDFNAFTACRQTPLMVLVQSSSPGRIESVRLLLEHGADPYLRGSDLMPGSGPSDTTNILQPKEGQQPAKFVIDKIASFQEQLVPEYPGLSAFEYAILSGRVRVVKEFIKHRAPAEKDLQHLRSDSARYLAAACKYQPYDLLLLLIELGLSPSQIPHSAPCILSDILSHMQAMLASRFDQYRVEDVRPFLSRLGKHLGTMALLIQHGVDVNRPLPDKACDGKVDPDLKSSEETFATRLQKEISEGGANGVLQCILQKAFSVEDDPAAARGQRLISCKLDTASLSRWFDEPDPVSFAAVAWVCKTLHGVPMPFEETTTTKGTGGANDQETTTTPSGWQQTLAAVMKLNSERESLEV